MAKKASKTTAPDGDLATLHGRVGTKLGAEIVNQFISFEEWNVEVSPENLLAVLRFLRDDSRLQFINLIDICGVDYPGDAERFEVVYHLLSPRINQRIPCKNPCCGGSSGAKCYSSFCRGRMV